MIFRRAGSFLNRLTPRIGILNHPYSSPSMIAVLALMLMAAVFAVLAYAALMSAASNERNRRLSGVWKPPITQDQVNRFLSVKRVPGDDGEFGYAIEEAKNFKEVSRDSAVRSVVRKHIRILNKKLAKKKFSSASAQQVIPDRASNRKGDHLLELEVDEGGANTTLLVRDLSFLNRYPFYQRYRRAKRDMGEIFFAPSGNNSEYYFLSNSFMNLFLTPSSPANEIVELGKSSNMNAGGIRINAPGGEPMANVSPDAAARAVDVEIFPPYCLVLDNEAPVRQGKIKDGEMGEIGGTAFQARVSKALPLAETASSQTALERRYPFKDLLSIIGPVSMTSSRQSLGMEYMFQEYLMGAPEDNIPKGAIWLTIDHRLQSQLTEAVKQIAPESKTQKVSSLIMNAKTGAILAMACSPNPYDPSDSEEIERLLEKKLVRYKNHGCFKRHNIGSVTKPFFAFGALNLIPNVDKMVLRAQSGTTQSIFGHRIYARNTKSSMKMSWAPTSFERYLVQSINPYQHSLGFILLSGTTNLNNIPQPWLKNDPETGAMLLTARTNDRLHIGTLQSTDVIHASKNNPFVKLMEQTFDIRTYESRGVVDDRDISIYGQGLLANAADILQRKDSTIRFPEDVLKSRSVVCAPEFPRIAFDNVTDTRQASQLLYGGRGNTWTDVKLCEAFSRIVTGLKVEARIVHSYTDTSQSVLGGGARDVTLEKAASPLDVQTLGLDKASFAKMKEILGKVPITGTAKKLAGTVKGMQAKWPNFKMVGKTGTINEFGPKQPDTKLFLGAFGILDDADSSRLDGLYTFVIYIQQAENHDAALDFINNSLPKWWDLLTQQNN